MTATPTPSSVASPNAAPCIAVAGAGPWGKNLVRNFSELGALAWVIDSDPARRAQMAADYPGVKVGERLEEALSDDAVRGVAIATPAITHGPLTRQVLQAGRDVFCEKPLALSVEETLENMALADAEGRILMVGHVLRYHPAVVEVIRLVQTGKVGRLKYVASHRLGWGRIRNVENVLWSFTPHDVSTLLAVAGEMPNRVSAGGSAFVQPKIHDIVTTRLTFPSGLEAHVFASWVHPIREQRLVIIGETGMLVFDELAEHKLSFHEKHVTFEEGRPVTTPSEAIPMPFVPFEPLKAEAMAFVRAIETREQPVTDAREGLNVLRVIEAAQSSMDDDGRTVELTAEPLAAPRGWFAHESATVDAGARVGRGARIWHYSHVSSGSEVGEESSLGQNCFVAKGVKVGRGCKIQNNVSLYEGVELEDEVFVGPSAVLTNVVNPRAHVSRKDAYAKTVLRRGSTIGANATVVCGVEVGAYAFVGAGAVVTRNVPAFAQVTGNPARLSGWRCRCGERLCGAGVSVGTTLTCDRCGDSYKLVGERELSWQEGPTP
jgi:UDP-2-acetamido-3-amino-2,3-dideoxy-glucuronate N-acetyltransferase